MTPTSIATKTRTAMRKKLYLLLCALSTFAATTGATVVTIAVPGQTAFTVPAGIGQMWVVAIGGGGGGAAGGGGGGAGLCSGTLAVFPGQTLSIVVGSGGLGGIPGGAATGGSETIVGYPGGGMPTSEMRARFGSPGGNPAGGAFGGCVMFGFQNESSSGGGTGGDGTQCGGGGGGGSGRLLTGSGDDGADAVNNIGGLGGGGSGTGGAGGSDCGPGSNGLPPGGGGGGTGTGGTVGGSGASGSVTFTFVPPPLISKAFEPATIGVNGTSTMTITVTNPDTETVQDGVAFTDNFPADMGVIGQPTSTCGGTTAVDSSHVLTQIGGTIPAGGSCTVALTVTGSVPGTLVNTTGPVSSINGGTGGIATATLAVGQSPADLTVTKVANGTFTRGQTGATYAITVANTGAGPTTGTVTVVDTLPAVLPTLVPTSLSGSGWTCALGTLTCTRSDVLAAGALYPPITLTVNVPANIDATFTNTATVSGGGETNTGNNTSAAAVVLPVAPTIAKAFIPLTIFSGASTTLTFTLTNPAANTVALTGVGFTDNLPGGLGVAGGSVPICGGTLTTSASGSIVLSGATIAVGGTCQFNVTVFGGPAGSFTNVTDAVSAANGGIGNIASSTLTVQPRPQIPALDSLGLWLLAGLLLVAAGGHLRRHERR